MRLIYALASNDGKRLDVFFIIPSLISLAFIVLLAFELVDQALCYKISIFDYVMYKDIIVIYIGNVFSVCLVRARLDQGRLINFSWAVP